MPKARAGPDLTELRRILNYDPETGVFSRRVRSSHAFPGDKVGCLRPDGYMQASVRGKTYLLHRLAAYHVTGEWPAGEVDHINGDRTDNRWANLRLVDRATNAQNERGKRRNKWQSEFMGVSPIEKTGKWVARICVNGRLRHVGTYATEEEAAEAYLSAKRELHPGFML